MVLLVLIILIIVIGIAYVNNEKFAVVSGTVELSNGSGQAIEAYPSGFTKDNCVVISSGCVYRGDGAVGFGFLQGSFGTGAALAENGIAFMAYSPEGIGSTGTYEFKIVLMKID